MLLRPPPNLENRPYVVVDQANTLFQKLVKMSHTYFCIFRIAYGVGVSLRSTLNDLFSIQTYVFSQWTWDVPCEVEPFKPTRLQQATVASAIDPTVTTSSSTSPPVSPSAASWRTSSSEDVTSPVVFEDFESEIDEEYWRKYQSLSASHNVFFATKTTHTKKN